MMDTATQPWYRRYVPQGALIKRAGRKAWYYKVRHDGQQKFVSLKTEIKIEAAHRAGQVYKNLFGCVPNTDIEKLLSDFTNHDSSEVNSNYLKNRRQAIQRFISKTGITSPDQITTELVNRWMDNCRSIDSNKKKGKLSNKTIKNYRASLGAFCRWMKTRGYILNNPIPDTECPAVIKEKIQYLTREEFDTALDTAEKHQRWAVFVAAYAGMRIAEIRELRWSDIDTDRQTILVAGKGRNGQKKIVTIPMHSKLVSIFKKIESIEGQQEIFPKHTKRWYQETYLAPIKIAVPKLSEHWQGWHTFRRTFGSLLIQDGVRVEVVSKLLRHADVSTTMKHYAELLPHHGKNDLERL